MIVDSDRFELNLRDCWYKKYIILYIEYVLEFVVICFCCMFWYIRFVYEWFFFVCLI